MVWDVPTDPNRYTPRMPAQQYQWTPTPVGCICPAGANKECENPDCPRKPRRPPSVTAVGRP